jgi:hypothetical protein
MGTWTRNFLIPKVDARAVRDVVVRWLERKGFDQKASWRLFADESEEERAAFVVWNAEWCVLVYQKAFDEGDRLLQELDDFPVVLEVLVADSDVWTYELIEDGELTAAFNSNPHYFGGNEQKLPRNGDPERLCKTLGMQGREAEVRRVQRRRSLFSDVPCQMFCRLIGASAGALHFGDLQAWNGSDLRPRKAGGWTIEPLYFERRRPLGEEPRPLDLHGLAIRQFTEQATPEPQLDTEILAQMKKVQKLMLLLRPLLWIFGRVARLVFWLAKPRLLKVTPAATGDELLDTISSLPAKTFTIEGDWMVSRQYGCRMKAGQADETRGERAVRMPHEVFAFSLGEIEVSGLAMRHDQVRKMFTLQNGSSAIDDRKFFAGSHPARHLAVTLDRTRNSVNVHYWIIEGKDFAVVFNTSMREPLPAETADAIQARVETLRFD